MNVADEQQQLIQENNRQREDCLEWLKRQQESTCTCCGISSIFLLLTIGVAITLLFVFAVDFPKSEKIVQNEGF